VGRRSGDDVSFGRAGASSEIRISSRGANPSPRGRARVGEEGGGAASGRRGVSRASLSVGRETHCVCVIGPGATLNGRPTPCAPTCAVGPLTLAYCASYAGSTPAGTTPGPMIGLWLTRAGIIFAWGRCDG